MINPLEETPRKNVSDIQGKKYFITNDKCLNKPNKWSIPMATFSFSSYRNKAINMFYRTQIELPQSNLHCKYLSTLGQKM